MRRNQIVLVVATTVTIKREVNKLADIANAMSIDVAVQASSVPKAAITSSKAVLRYGSPEEIEAVRSLSCCGVTQPQRGKRLRPSKLLP
jgi:hypothetical protein